MMRRRVGRPGLVGTMARTAVVAGTATAVSGGVARRQQHVVVGHEISHPEDPGVPQNGGAGLGRGNGVGRGLP